MKTDVVVEDDERIRDLDERDRLWSESHESETRELIEASARLRERLGGVRLVKIEGENR